MNIWNSPKNVRFFEYKLFERSKSQIVNLLWWLNKNSHSFIFLWYFNESVFKMHTKRKEIKSKKKSSMYLKIWRNTEIESERKRKKEKKGEANEKLFIKSE